MTLTLFPFSYQDAESELKRPAHFDVEQLAKRARTDDFDYLSTSLGGGDTTIYERTKFVRPEANTLVISSSSSPFNRRKLPIGWSILTVEETGKEYFRNDFSGQTQWEFPIKPAERPSSSATSSSLKTSNQTMDANALVAQAEQAAREAKEAEMKKLQEEEAEKKREKEERYRRKKKRKKRGKGRRRRRKLWVYSRLSL